MMKSETKRSRLKTDPDAIVEALEYLLDPGQTIELRALDAVLAGARWARPQTVSGYFNDPWKLAKAVSTQIVSATGVYFTPNPVDPALLARASNHLAPAKQGQTTADKDILSRRHLLIDVDHERPAGISSTDEEHKKALAVARHIGSALAAEGWPRPLARSDSGNGAHLDYRIDLVNDAEALTLVNGCLAALAGRFNGDGIKIDLKVGNASRIWKLPGTPVRKGDDTRERPHRLARVLKFARWPRTVSWEQLEAAAGAASGAPETPPAGRSPFNLDTWVERHCKDRFTPRSPQPYDGNGRIWNFKVCPWDESHGGGQAFLIQRKSGVIQAGCHHDSCKGKDWRALRDLMEPGWREKRQEKAAGGPKDPAKWKLVIEAGDPAKPLKDVRWLWAFRIPRAMITVLAGNIGAGKSLLAIDIAARITRGRSWPDADDGGEGKSRSGAGRVLFFSAEDIPADIIFWPRMRAAGADTTRVYLAHGVCREDDEGPTQPFTLADLDVLEERIKTIGHLRLIVIDPIMSYVGATDANLDASVRTVMTPLADLAARHDVAVLCIMHLNKKTAEEAIYRVGGSMAWLAVARSAWLVGQDPECSKDPDRGVIAPLKCNIARRATSMGFRKEAVKVRGLRGDQTCIKWTPGDAGVDADALLTREKRSPKKDKAAAWLSGALAQGEQRASTLKSEAGAAGISEHTLERAADDLGVTRGKKGFGKGAVTSWRLPPPKSAK